MASKKSVVLQWTGTNAKDKLKLKVSVPESWADRPASKLAGAVVKALNAKQPGRRLEVDAVAMARGGGAPLPAEARCASLVDGETIRVGPAPAPAAAALAAARAPAPARAPVPFARAAPAKPLGRVAQGRNVGPTGGYLRAESSAAAGAAKRCALCGLASTRRCGRCSLPVFYCSGTCQRAHWKAHRGDCDAHELEESRTRVARTETKTIMPGVHMECTARAADDRPKIKLTVYDKLSTRRHELEYAEDTTIHTVKQAFRDLEKPRYRHENHMGPLFAEVKGKPGRVLFDFKTLKEQNVQSGDTLHHIVHNPTLLQRTGFDTCPGTL